MKTMAAAWSYNYLVLLPLLIFASNVTGDKTPTHTSTPDEHLDRLTATFSPRHQHVSLLAHLIEFATALPALVQEEETSSGSGPTGHDLTSEQIDHAVGELDLLGDLEDGVVVV
ncbi:unnamed protein product, partial [Amoebophrya sp. A25]|eukprot:GSA25T00020254001.1